MNVILGKDVVIEFYKQGAFRKFVCAENIEFSPTMSLKSVKTIGDGIYESWRGQSVGYTISVTGIIPYDEPEQVNAFDLLEYLKQMVDIDYRVLFYNQDGGQVTQVRGRVLVNDMTISGPVDFAGTSMSLKGNGPFEIGAVPECNIQILNAVLMADGIMRTAMVLSVNGGPVLRYDYKYITTEGAEITGTSFSPSWEFLPYEGGAMFIYALCENGVAGPGYVLDVNDDNITGPCTAIILHVDVTVIGSQRKIDITDHVNATTFTYEFQTTSGITRGVSQSTSFFLDNINPGQLRITPVCSSGLTGTVYTTSLTAVVAAAKIIDVGCSVGVGVRKFTVYHSENALTYRWQYRVGLDIYDGTETLPVFEVPDYGLGEFDIVPINEQGFEGNIDTLVLTAGQSNTCASEIIKTSYEDGDFGFGLERRVTIEEVTGQSYVKYDYRFDTDDPAYPGTYAGTANINQFSFSAPTHGVLRIIPYCDLTRRGVTYYLIIT